ncbi:glycosyltransferase family A protein [Enterobacter hormaechei]
MSVSVITPVYNRANLIDKLFFSLKEQTSQAFEWIIVDDGSTDNLKEIVSDFKRQASFKINYTYKSNGGKHTALNEGIPLAEYEWVFIVDSDDTLPTNAIAVVNEKIKNIKELTCKGLVFLKAYESTKAVIGDINSLNKVNSNQFAGVKGDKAIIFRRDSFIENKFPTCVGENFLTEAYLWNRILEKGYFQCWNEVIYYAEYLEGGLTSNYKNLLKKNPVGTLSFVLSNLNLNEIGLNIYKQSAFHFLPICDSSNIKILFKKVNGRVFFIFMLCLTYTYIKSKVKGIIK